MKMLCEHFDLRYVATETGGGKINEIFLTDEDELYWEGNYEEKQDVFYRNEKKIKEVK